MPATKLILPQRFAGHKYKTIGEAPEDKKKEVIFREIGDLSKYRLMSGRVLVAIYFGGDRHEGTSILRSDDSLKEDRWQSSVGLVIKKGPLAFRDDEATNTRFYGQDIEIGEWVIYNPGDGRRVQINGVDCRVFEDAVLTMTTEEPWAITHFQ